jgi:hypothetical protein
MASLRRVGPPGAGPDDPGTVPASPPPGKAGSRPRDRLRPRPVLADPARLHPTTVGVGGSLARRSAPGPTRAPAPSGGRPGGVGAGRGRAPSPHDGVRRCGGPPRERDRDGRPRRSEPLRGGRAREPTGRDLRRRLLAPGRVVRGVLCDGVREPVTSPDPPAPAVLPVRPGRRGGIPAVRPGAERPLGVPVLPGG